MKISVGPTGNIVKGHVLDSNINGIKEAIQKYDDKLYIKWNPKKFNGWGCWEIRRRPDLKISIPQGTVCLAGIKGTISTLEYKEIELNNHVFSRPYLNYQVLDDLKACDMWVQGNYEKGNHRKFNQTIKTWDEANEEKINQEKAKLRKEAIYGLTQESGAIKTFKQAILDGVHPANIAKHWR